MTRLSPKSNPARQRGFRWEYAWRMTGSAARVLFLFLFPALAWSQEGVPDKPSGPRHEEQTQPSGGTGDSVTPPDAAALSKSLCGNPKKELPPAEAVIEPQALTARLASCPDVVTQIPKPQMEMPTPTPDAIHADRKKDNSEGKQTQRMFWIIPNFAAVSADTELPPLDAREKFALATQDSVDYSSFVWAGMLAGQSMALRSYPELHNGVAGYSRYYWRAFADQASGSFFTEAIVPALTHEDPRYYTLGHGGFFRRVGYALSRVVLTKTDFGGTSFNYSEIVGNGMEAGLANFYYPPEERGLGSTAVNWVSQLEAASLNNIIREFWPDIRRKVFRQK